MRRLLPMRTLLVLAAASVLWVAFLAYLAVRSRTAPALEVRDGRLRPCPRTSNCVNTQDESRGIAPLPTNGAPAAAFATLRAVVTALPRTTVLAEGDGYLRVECATPVFGFRDDFEALLDPAAAVIHLRSASRVGLSDRGLNRRRIEGVRERYLAALAGPSPTPAGGDPAGP
jgi:uncharacterized protein (DUF1499 family)